MERIGFAARDTQYPEDADVPPESDAALCEMLGELSSRTADEADFWEAGGRLTGVGLVASAAEADATLVYGLGASSEGSAGSRLDAISARLRLNYRTLHRFRFVCGEGDTLAVFDDDSPTISREEWAAGRDSHSLVEPRACRVGPRRNSPVSAACARRVWPLIRDDAVLGRD